MIEEKIYSPYFITNNMVINYPKLKEAELISVRDIIQYFIKSKQINSKLFFKCDMDMFEKNESKNANDDGKELK